MKRNFWIFKGIAAILILELSACGLPRASSRPALSKWGTAIRQDQYELAAALVVNDPATVTAWIGETQQLTQQHDGVKGVQSGDLPALSTLDQPPVVLTNGYGMTDTSVVCVFKKLTKVVFGL